MDKSLMPICGVSSRHVQLGPEPEVDLLHARGIIDPTRLWSPTQFSWMSVRMRQG